MRNERDETFWIKRIDFDGFQKFVQIVVAFYDTLLRGL